MAKQQRSEYPVVGTWPLDDEVIALRVSGTDDSYALAAGAHAQVIGTSAACDVVLRDPARTVAPEHARLVRRHAHWTIRAIGDDLDVLCRDRVPLREFPLVPGLEISLGDVTLIAESERSRALHAMLRRLIGFDARYQVEVDRALRTVLTTASGRGVLTLCGSGDLVSVAHQLHRRMLPGQPFVVCDPRRGEGSAHPLLAPNIRDPMDALGLAAGGTLCLPADRPPHELPELAERRRNSTTRVQLVIVTETVHPVLAAIAEPVVVTPLARRAAERLRLIDELAAEAAATLGIEVVPLSDAHRRAILRFDGSTPQAIEKATLRIIALRNGGHTSRVAKQLDMSHASLTEWALRRGLVAKRPRGRPPRPKPDAGEALAALLPRPA